ncbi:MAG TPA: hypothetical protein VF587_20180 [Solirubrobacteraceae bacterium]|jgi:hypothetical protein
MHVRVVRFTDVNSERLKDMQARVEQSDGPPEGVPATGIQLLVDDEQKTAVVLQFFDSREDLEAGAKVFAAMDPSDTPGTRASVDACELRLERRAPS